MSKVTPKESKDQILAAFNQLLTERKKSESKVETKEQEAEKEKNQQLLETVAGYTIDNIVNGMAALQLDFGSAMDELSQKLETEWGKLDELKQGIATRHEHLQQLRQVRLVADALYILRQENEAKLSILEANTTTEREEITKEMTQTRKVWEKEQQEFEAKIAEARELLARQQEGEEGDYNYETERLRKIEMDEYREQKRLQERELAAANRDKEKAWAAREQFLADNEAEFGDNETKIAGFDDKLAQEYNKAKEEAIKKAEREGKVKADLLEKEWKADQQGYEFKIQSLQETITRQTEQIGEINAQLQATTTQAQNLAMRAFQNTDQ